MSIISLSKLSDGGAAIFADANRNHHKDIIGADDNNPFIKYILRVWVSSYVRFARENKAEEDKPCAIIINVAPIRPNWEFDNAPASINPI
jgi:hypothetical protein